MNKLAVQRQSRPLLPELSELFSGFPMFASLPSIAGLRPFFDNNLLRLEDETREGLYQVRAELPGVDPIEDIEVTVRDGQLTIKAERARPARRTGSRSSRMDRSPAPWRCPMVPTRTTSTRPTTAAS